MRCASRRRQALGFTVIEILVVLTLAAILLSLAAPQLAGFARGMRLSTSMSELGSDLLLARSESIRRNARVMVCPRATATSSACATTVAASTWMNGWLVCHDTNADGSCDAGSATDPNPIRVRSRPPSPLSLAGPAASVTFFPTGNASGAAIFTMSTSYTTSTRSVTVAPSGGLTSSKT